MGCSSSKSVDSLPPPRMQLVKYNDRERRLGSPPPTMLEIVEHKPKTGQPTSMQQFGQPSNHDPPEVVNQLHDSLVVERHFHSAQCHSFPLQHEGGDLAERLSGSSNSTLDSMLGNRGTHHDPSYGRAGRDRTHHRSDRNRRDGRSGRRARRRHHDRSRSSGRQEAPDQVSSIEGQRSSFCHSRGYKPITPQGLGLSGDDSRLQGTTAVPSNASSFELAGDCSLHASQLDEDLWYGLARS